MKTTVDFRADNDGNIVEITTTTYTPDEWLAKAGEVYKFAQSMGARPNEGLRRVLIQSPTTVEVGSNGSKKIAAYTDISNMDDTDRKIEAMYGVKLGD